MIFHDGDCNEISISHVPAESANPNIWGIGKNDWQYVVPEEPVSGWRFVRAVYTGSTLLGFGVFDPDEPGIWEGTIPAPRATCDPAQLRQRTMLDKTRRILSHGAAPEPGCECGYRVVRSITEMNKYMRWTRTRLADVPPAFLPAHVRDEYGDAPVSQSFVLASVLGCGGVTSCESDLWTDPDGTVRVEWLAARLSVVAAEGDPVVDALAGWGFNVVVVPNVNDVHEVDECGEYESALASWRMSAPSPAGGVVLEVEDAPDVFEHYTLNRRFGLYGAAGVALVNDDRVLLVRSGEFWQLPGGARREGESVGSCVVRETFEETGVDLTGVPVSDAFVCSDAAGWSYTTVVVDAPAGVVPVADAEVSDVGWFSVPPVGTHPDLIEVWDRILQ